MSITLDKFREKLVIKILQADSPQATERYVRAAVKSMLQKSQFHIVTRLLGHVNSHLCNFKTPSTPLQQWTNIRTAAHTLQHMRDSMDVHALYLE